MTNYDNILDSNSFHAMSTKELIAIGRYINNRKNGEIDLLEDHFFDAMITRLSDVSGDNDRLCEALLEERLEERDARPIPPFADPEEEDCDFFDRENDSINRFCEEFSEKADVVGGDLGASMNQALGIIENLRADVGELEEAVDDLLDGDDPMVEEFLAAFRKIREERDERRWEAERVAEAERDERRFSVEDLAACLVDPMNEYARCGKEEREALIKREARKIGERRERCFQEFYRNCAPCAPKSNPPF